MDIIRNVLRRSNKRKNAKKEQEENNGRIEQEQLMEGGGVVGGATNMREIVDEKHLRYKHVINKDQQDEMELWCYKKSPLKLFTTYTLIVLSCGLLRLLFHWIPHWYLYATSNLCDVLQGQTILVKEIFGGKHTIYHVKQLKCLTPESIEKMKKLETSSNLLIPTLSVHFENGEFRDLDQLLLFNLKKVTYIWNAEKYEFNKLTGLDHGVATSTLHNNHCGLTANQHWTRLIVYGPNKIVVKQLSILTLLFLEVLNPFYIFQIASFILWFMDDYVAYAMAIILMSVFGISMSVRQTRKNQAKLKSTVHTSDVCTVLRRKEKLEESAAVETETISTELLVPGDVLVIPSHGCIMHCDAVLLNGNCILNESMLTGESVPVTKTGLPNHSQLFYDAKEHARHTLFCGTQVIQTRYFSNEKVLAIVVRTGFSTAKGSLVRSILYPPPVDFRFEKDSYRFTSLLAAVAFLGFIYTIVTKTMRGLPARDLIVEALDLITIVVPPALPAAMTVGRFYAQIRLQKREIFCISPRTINVSGSIDCVCFDKTGTLTEDGLDLLCVVPIKEKMFLLPVKKVDEMQCDDAFFSGLVSCHSLTIIENKIVGDPLDLKMFESTKWVMEAQDGDEDASKFNSICPTVLKSSEAGADEIGIIREFPFSSSSQRMGVIIRKLNGQHFEYYAKGSPEMILNFVRTDSIPADFHSVLETYTQEGYRVIALAHKVLKLSYTKAMKCQRETIETDMQLLGLIVLENRLKPETMECIQALNEAKIRCVMVTGDNILTALSVARDCDLITDDQSAITINVDSTSNQLFYQLTEDRKQMMAASQSQNGDVSLMTNSASVVSLATIESQINSSLVEEQKKKKNYANFVNNYRFALTGKVWDVLKTTYPELLGRIVTRGTIFARMSPEQKQELVQELQSLGYCVAMCGDGANDCGALKAAHTGISLSEAESSVASPFTSKNANIQCVLDVIKEGRAALVTSFGLFKYMAAYSLCQFVSVLILYSIDSNLTDIEFLYIDLFIITIFAFFFGKTEAYGGKLVKETPLSSLISLSPILSLFLQMVLVIVMQVGAFEYLKIQPWYKQFEHGGDDKDDVKCVENFTIFTMSSFQYIILAVVFSKGKPYRKSIFSNYGFILSTIAMVLFSIYLTLWPHEFFLKHFELVLPKSQQFSLNLLILALVNFLLSLFIELVVIDYVVFKKLRFKFHKIDKSKRKYLAIERDLNLDGKWPTLSSTNDYLHNNRSSMATSVISPTLQAEIVIEKEKFDKNHVLNKLYDVVVEQNKIIEAAATASPSKQVDEDETTTTFKSFTNNEDNTSYDLANSRNDLDELPYDGDDVVVNGCDKGRNSSSSSSTLSSFNSFGASPIKKVDNGDVKGLEMNYLINNNVDR